MNSCSQSWNVGQDQNQTGDTNFSIANIEESLKTHSWITFVKWIWINEKQPIDPRTQSMGFSFVRVKRRENSEGNTKWEVREWWEIRCVQCWNRMLRCVHFNHEWDMSSRQTQGFASEQWHGNMVWQYGLSLGTCRGHPFLVRDLLALPLPLFDCLFPGVCQMCSWFRLWKQTFPSLLGVHQLFKAYRISRIPPKETSR